MWGKYQLSGPIFTKNSDLFKKRIKGGPSAILDIQLMFKICLHRVWLLVFFNLYYIFKQIAINLEIYLNDRLTVLAQCILPTKIKYMLILFKWETDIS